MDLARFRRFTARLTERLAGDPRVVGLVALGSMAEQGTLPDEFSDHDLFVVTVPGAEEAFRRDLSWLPPDAGCLVLSHRETEHGLKAITDDGHLVELAVFDLDSLRAARVNRYRVLLDRGGVAGRMAEVAGATVAANGPGPGDRYLAGQLLGNLLVGASRAARGELLSARQFVASHALRHLLVLVGRHVPPGSAVPLDDLDPFRRVEAVYPGLSREIEVALCRGPLEGAGLLLDLAVRELAGRVPEFPAAAAAAVRSRIGELATGGR